MEKSDKIFLIWGIIVIGFVIIVGISDTTAEHIETYGIVSAIVDLFAIIGFLVFAPYVIHRLIVKRKL
ncbi:MAG: hypothetical protein CO032_00460 [Nitrosopumilales archaeon CG_4_9_14_0_2_um_filter_34_16]|jgi:flagellar biogenesis protein FliO|nr:MAG: hypothetical protein CO032_00460 [Nitrosopumilales archaeon CG_4_9_14_0_2_um_filter_34_16]